MGVGGGGKEDHAPSPTERTRSRVRSAFDPAFFPFFLSRPGRICIKDSFTGNSLWTLFPLRFAVSRGRSLRVFKGGILVGLRAWK